MAWTVRRSPQPQTIVADADYFQTRARLSYRRARQATDLNAAHVLETLGKAFEQKARAVAEPDNAPGASGRPR